MYNYRNILSDFINKIIISQNYGLKYFVFIYTKLIFSISKILFFEEYFNDLFLIFFDNFLFIVLFLKYNNSLPVIRVFKKFSKQNQKIYKNYKFIPKFFNNFGVIIISSNFGIITDRLSKILGIGGKLICYVF